MLVRPNCVAIKLKGLRGQSLLFYSICSICSCVASFFNEYLILCDLGDTPVIFRDLVFKVAVRSEWSSLDSLLGYIIDRLSIISLKLI
jgi:hypothetical protein